MSTQSDLLVGAYASQTRPPPQWACQLPAPIPFIGSDYGRDPLAPRLLVYASTENINTQIREAERAPWLDRAGRPSGHPSAVRRHQWSWKATNHEKVGIAPFEDGPLRAAAALLWRWEAARRGLTAPPTTPEVLTESIAIANLSKFAYRTDGKSRNKDVTSVAHLTASLPYLRCDLIALGPTVLLIAKTVPETIAAEVAEFAQPALIVWMPQAAAQALSIAQSSTKALQIMGGGHLEESTEDRALARCYCSLTHKGWAAWRLLLRARYLAAAALQEARR